MKDKKTLEIPDTLVIPPGTYEFVATKASDEQGRSGYEIVLTYASNDPRISDYDGINPQRTDPELLDEIRDALAENSEEWEFLTYPAQEDSFLSDFIKMRDRARRAFRESTASDKKVDDFESCLETDDELVEKAVLIRRLYSMGLDDSEIAFRRYVDEVHGDAIKYATKVLSS